MPGTGTRSVPAETAPAEEEARTLRVAVVIGSTREGRAGDAVGRWFTGRAARHTGVETAVLDLADFAFPAHYPQRPTPQMTEFTAAVDLADAFVIVTPEYNRSFPASLKQAVDYAYDEWHAKPVGFVSYGCRSEGRYAVDALRPVFTELHAVTVRDSVGLDLLADGAGPDGVPHAGPHGERAERAAAAMLDQLVWWGLALREARGRRPYVS